MALIEWDPQIIPGLKLSLHSFQIIAVAILWILEIAVFLGDKAEIVGLNGWTFAVCFLSVPAWIFLVLTPRFDRTRKFADPIAMFAVDIVFFILWISAFATQAAYNAQNRCGTKCGISKGIVGLGVVVTLLWAASTVVSAYTMQYSNFHGSLPGYDNRKLRNAQNIDPDKAAFSMAPHDEEAYERVNVDDHDNDHDHHSSLSRYDDPSIRYGAANPYSATDDFEYSGSAVGGGGAAAASSYGGSVSGRQTVSLFESTESTEYSSPAGAGGLGLSGYNTSTSPRPADEPVKFPSGNYDRIQG